ncbi:putative ribonuclease H-like domain-containing protein [Tanacetum coccineum]
MSKQHYNEIMSKGLESRHKPSNPSKYSNFVGRIKGLKVFVGNFTYECNFMVLEDTTSIIDHHLGKVVFGKPFARNTGLIYDQEKGTVTFEKDDEKITFKMPHKMETFNQIDFKDINTDYIPPFILESNDGRGKTYYSDRSGPNWLFDIDALTKSINYKTVVTGNQSNGNAGIKACNDAGKVRMETVLGKDYILLPMWPADLLFSQDSKSSPDAGFKPIGEEEKKDVEDPGNEDSEVPSIEEPRINQEKDDNINSTNNINTASDGNSTNKVNVVSSTINAVGIEVNVVDPKISIELPNDPNMPELEDIVYSNNDKDVGAEADKNNLDAFMHFSKEQTIKTFKIVCLLAFYHKKNPRRNKKDERGIMIKNKARLVAQGYTKEEGIDYDEVFAPVARIEEIRLFLAYASFKDSMVYQMDVKSAFIYGKIKEEVYVYQPLGFKDSDFPNRVYKVEKGTLWIASSSKSLVYVDGIIFRSTKKMLCTEFEKMMHKKFQMSSIGELTFFLGLQVKQKEDGIFISQDKYVIEILKKFGFSDVKTASTPMETHKPLLKDADGKDVDKHMYRSMIGSLMYLTSSRPDIMFADSPFDLVAYTDSDYAGASLDKKSTTGGCQFLVCRLISWQCKKQTVVTNSIIEAEYIAASN